MPQSVFAVKVKGLTKIGRQKDKRTATDRDTHNTFTDFTGRWQVAHVDQSRRDTNIHTKNLSEKARFTVVNKALQRTI